METTAEQKPGIAPKEFFEALWKSIVGRATQKLVLSATMNTCDEEFWDTFCAPFFQPANLFEICEERNLNNRCGNPFCFKKLNNRDDVITYIRKPDDTTLLKPESQFRHCGNNCKKSWKKLLDSISATEVHTRKPNSNTLTCLLSLFPNLPTHQLESLLKNLFGYIGNEEILDIPVSSSIIASEIVEKTPKKQIQQPASINTNKKSVQFEESPTNENENSSKAPPKSILKTAAGEKSPVHRKKVSFSPEESKTNFNDKKKVKFDEENEKNEEKEEQIELSVSSPSDGVIDDEDDEDEEDDEHQNHSHDVVDNDKIDTAGIGENEIAPSDDASSLLMNGPITGFEDFMDDEEETQEILDSLKLDEFGEFFGYLQHLHSQKTFQFFTNKNSSRLAKPELHIKSQETDEEEQKRKTDEETMEKYMKMYDGVENKEKPDEKQKSEHKMPSKRRKTSTNDEKPLESSTSPSQEPPKEKKEIPNYVPVNGYKSGDRQKFNHSYLRMKIEGIFKKWKEQQIFIDPYPTLEMKSELDELLITFNYNRDHPSQCPVVFWDLLLSIFIKSLSTIDNTAWKSFFNDYPEIEQKLMEILEKSKQKFANPENFDYFLDYLVNSFD